MITVVNENTAAALAVNSNPYPGMTLAEACNSLQLETTNILHEFQMDILLTEHAYLHENGVEIQYVNEDGNETEAGSNLKKKMSERWGAVKDKIMELWDKLIQWTSAHMTQLVEKLSKVGLTEKKFNTAMKAVFESGARQFVPVNISVAFDPEWRRQMNATMFKNADRMISSEDYKDGAINVDLFEKFTHEATDTDKKIGYAGMKTAAMEVFHPEKNVIKDIMANKKSCNESLEKARKELLKVKDNGDNREDEIGRKVAALNDSLKYNTEVTRQAVKMYHTYVSNAVTMIRTLMATEEAKDAIRGERVENIKHTASAPARAASSVMNKAKELKNKYAKKRDDDDDELAPEEVIPANESTDELYNGKFFNI